MSDRPEQGESAEEPTQASQQRTGRHAQSGADDGAPSYGSPDYSPSGYDEPYRQQPGDQQPGQPPPGYPPPGPYQPGYQQASSQQPGYQQPAGQQPGYQQPAGQQPGYQQPGGQQPGGQQPGYPQSGGQQPGYQQPGGQQPGYQQSGGQQPGYQQPGNQQPGYPPAGYPPPGQAGFAQTGYPVETQRRPRDRRRTGLIAGLIAGGVVLALLLVIGAVLIFRAPGVHTAAGDLQNTTQALADVKQAWTSDLKSTGFTPPNDGECYFSVAHSSDLASDTIACGPFLRPEVAKANVWDLYGFTRRSSGEVQPVTDAPRRAQPQPGGSYLVDDSGREQDIDISGIKAAPYPSAAATSLWSAGSFTIDDADLTDQFTLPENPTLVGFSAAYQVASVQAIRKVKLTQAPARTVQAPSGQQLYVITFGSAKTANTIDGVNRFSIQNGAKSVQVPGSAGTQVLATAAKSGLLMRLETGGVVQSLDLLSGKRVTDPRTDELAKRAWPARQDRNIRISYPRVQGPDGATYGLTVTVEDIVATPYDDGTWAPAGQLQAETLLDADAESTRAAGATYTVGCTATVDGGTMRSCDGGVKGFANLRVTLSSTGSAAGLHISPTIHVSRGSDSFDVTFPTRDVAIPMP